MKSFILFFYGLACIMIIIALNTCIILAEGDYVVFLPFSFIGVIGSATMMLVAIHEEPQDMEEPYSHLID